MSFYHLILLFPLLLSSLNAISDQSTSSACKDQLRVKLLELIEKDNGSILKAQFTLTTLKVTKRLMKEKNQTLEEMIKKTTLNRDNLNIKDPKILMELNQYYDENNTDLTDERVMEFASKSNALNYFNKHQRLNNNDVGSYMLIDKVLNKNTDFDKSDVAIVWFMQQVSDKVQESSGKFSSEHNMTNVSNIVYKNIGGVKHVNALSEEEIETKINDLSNKLTLFYAEATKIIKSDLKDCLENGYLGTNECNQDYLQSNILDLLKDYKNIDHFITNNPQALAASPKQNKEEISNYVFKEAENKTNQATHPGSISQKNFNSFDTLRLSDYNTFSRTSNGNLKNGDHNKELKDVKALISKEVEKSTKIDDHWFYGKPTTKYKCPDNAEEVVFKVEKQSRGIINILSLVGGAILYDEYGVEEDSSQYILSIGKNEDDMKNYYIGKYGSDLSQSRNCVIDIISAECGIGRSTSCFKSAR